MKKKLFHVVCTGITEIQSRGNQINVSLPQAERLLPAVRQSLPFQNKVESGKGGTDIFRLPFRSRFGKAGIDDIQFKGFPCLKHFFVF